MKVSVVMATYDGAKWLATQLQSIATQRYQPAEMIISDDGSSDGTRSIIDEFRRNSPFPVSLLNGPRQGLADNFWQATIQARGDAIAWSDQDDVWRPDKLAIAVEALRSHPDVELVTHSAIVTAADLSPTRQLHPRYRVDRVLKPLEGDPWGVPSGFASVARRTLIEVIPWERRPISHQTGKPVAHDHAVALAAFARSGSIQLATPAAYYRQHGLNAAGAPTRDARRRLAMLRGNSAARFAGLAETATSYGEYAASVAGASPDTLRFFEAVALRCARRKAVYASTDRRRRAQALVAAVRGGTYLARQRGAFGARGLAIDFVVVALPHLLTEAGT
jgi:hypothetical protein